MNEVFRSAGDQFRQKIPQLSRKVEVRTTFTESINHSHQYFIPCRDIVLPI